MFLLTRFIFSFQTDLERAEAEHPPRAAPHRPTDPAAIARETGADRAEVIRVTETIAAAQAAAAIREREAVGKIILVCLTSRHAIVSE